MADKAVLNVKGMSCGHCVKAVEESVGKMAGVNAVSVDLKAATVAVDFESSQTSVQHITETIEDQGYDVV
ncbi:copper chaperone CopZ [Sporosarcina thermotolerans]|uniref:Copper chaperone CopZ n=1 Tax=Sporosarcina thermotolerans TaxID=633404 RepID=A0AAW9AAH8_9BACL|nr:copper chaperone CopZ [Sporosarcina thermotolerans]MDW0118049.1 copper chaperone CopZ [Sporosarcina thermotolerans]WHT49107.1 copper chaperone CopZ [Sporosarcina thermotolerans]